jgi:hypothetical protein
MLLHCPSPIAAAAVAAENPHNQATALPNSREPHSPNATPFANLLQMRDYPLQYSAGPNVLLAPFDQPSVIVSLKISHKTKP